MTYQLSPRLFVEHGAAVLAQRARSSAREYKLLEQSGCNDGPGPPAGREWGEIFTARR